MMKTRKMGFFEKATIFCYKHKFWFGLGAGMLGAYFTGRHIQTEKYQAQEKTNREKKERKAYENDPKNQVCGGTVDDDWWDEGGDGWTCATMILSGVPLDQLGPLAEALRERAAQGGCGVMESDELNELLNNEKACCSVVLSVEEEDSQAEQAEKELPGEKPEQEPAQELPETGTDE